MSRIAHLVAVGLALSGSVALAAPASAAAATYYVAQTGADTNAGLSVLTPFRTIQKCADVAVAGDTCLIRGGTYRETVKPASSGTETARITYAPYAGEKVTVSGADVIGGPWTPATVEDLPLNQRGAGGFEAGVAGGHIYKSPTTLPDSPLINEPEPFVGAFHLLRDTQLVDHQLFVDGAMANEARWPNSGPNPLTPTFAVAGPATNTHLIDDAQLTQPTGFWTGALLAVIGSNFDEAGSFTATVTANVPGAFNYLASRNTSQIFNCPNQFCAWPHNRYFLSKILGALDSPGEWFVQGGTAWMWAPDGQSPAGHLVEAKTRSYAFDLIDRSYITVQGINVVAASMRTDPTSTHNVFDGIDARYVSHFVQVKLNQFASPQAPTNTGIILAGTDNTLRNSRITFSAGHGVLVTGQRNTVTNNLISEIDYGGGLCAGVWAWNPNDNQPGTAATITRNTIYNTADSGIIVTTFPEGGKLQKDNEVGYNNVFNTMQFFVDQGAIESYGNGANLDLSGNRFHHNWAHQSAAKTDRHGANQPYMTSGLYFDLGAHKAVIDHNVSWNNGGEGIRMNGDNTNPTANLIANNTVGEGQHRGLATFFAIDTTGTEVANNIFRRPNQDLPPGAVYSNNVLSDVDPLFVDNAKPDFQLQAGSPAIDAGKVIPGVTDGYLGAAPDAGAYEYGAVPWVPGCTLAACDIAFVDDAATSDPSATLTYTGSWTHCTTACDPGTYRPFPYVEVGDEPLPGLLTTYNELAFPFAGSHSSSSTAGDTVTATFTGDSVTVHAQKAPDGGIVALSVDGGPEVLADTFTEVATGDQIIGAFYGLAPGTHTLTLRVTGTHHPLSTGNKVYLDRVDVLKVAPAPAPRKAVRTKGPKDPVVPPPPPEVASGALWTDATGDASASSLDVKTGSVSCEAGKLTFITTLTDLNLATITGNARYQVYRMTWELGGTRYFADAAISIDGGGTVYQSFADGTYLADGTEVLQHSATGTIVPGPDAVVSITIPLTNVGVTGSAVLTNVTGQALSYPWYAFYLGAPTPQATGTVMDTGGPTNNVTVTATGCSGTLA